MIEIKLVKTSEEMLQFINLPWKIYRYNYNWVPPLKNNLLKELTGKDNILFMNGPYQFLMAYKNDQPVARVLVGINEKLNEKKNMSDGYLSLFESVNNQDICFSLLDKLALNLSLIC